MKLIFKSISLICFKDGDRYLTYIKYPHTHVGLGYYRVIIKRVG